ncbi:hypothetical protein ACUN0C_16935 [Faunimonas sp. B44]|uniref:hypothetical protein n=1 Tax=Faunimonas sp. B44 TaxID=3461493 RepID=UPI004044D5B5
MARDIDRSGSPLSAEYDAGGDDDLPGMDQPVTADDIAAILSSPGESVGSKRNLLLRIRDDLTTRSGMDMEHEFDSLIVVIDDALASLDMSAEGYGGAEGYGMDPDMRAASPEEELERAEDEAAEDRD